jgi:hypothetical protein
MFEAPHRAYNAFACSDGLATRGFPGEAGDSRNRPDSFTECFTKTDSRSISISSVSGRDQPLSRSRGREIGSKTVATRQSRPRSGNLGRGENGCSFSPMRCAFMQSTDTEASEGEATTSRDSSLGPEADENMRTKYHGGGVATCPMARFTNRSVFCMYTCHRKLFVVYPFVSDKNGILPQPSGASLLRRAVLDIPRRTLGIMNPHGLITNPPNMPPPGLTTPG